MEMEGDVAAGGGIASLHGRDPFWLACGR